jgi:hypothetical protein
MNTNTVRRALLTLALLGAGSLAACGGDDGSPTSPSGTNNLQPGSVVPISRTSHVAARARAGFGDQVNDVTETAPGVLDLTPFVNSVTATSTGANDLGRESRGSGDAGQSSTFVIDRDDEVSSLRFVGAASISGSVNPDPEGNRGDTNAFAEGRSEMTFEFMADEDGLLIVADGEYEFTGEEFCVQIYLEGRNPDGDVDGPGWELDVCEEVGNGAYAVADTLELRQGYTYELWVEIVSADIVGSAGPAAAEASSAATFDVDFRILKAPLTN